MPNKSWVDNRTLAFQFRCLGFPTAAVPPLWRLPTRNSADKRTSECTCEDFHDLEEIQATMLSQHTGVLARILGVGICLITTLFVGYLVAGVLSSAPQTPWWHSIIAFTFLGLAAWSFTSFGKWLWSIEEGWFGLQRYFRLIQTSLIGGGFACDITFRILYLYRII